MAISKKNTESKDLIEHYVYNKINSNYDLTLAQKCKLVAVHIRGLESYNKEALLCEADRNSILPDLLANLIEEKASKESVQKFLDAIFGIYVIGMKDSNPAFHYDFEEMFDEALAKREEKFSTPDPDLYEYENDPVIAPNDTKWGA